MSTQSAAAGTAHVTAVIVAHDGEPWLPRLLSGLEASTRLPDRIVAVDTGSTDSTPELLSAALDPASIVDAPRPTGFGDAVRLGLDAVDRSAGDRREPAGDDDAWVWLLHDDCRPAPDALERLLATIDEAAADAAAVDVVGCRLRAWPRGRRLLEVGVTITGTGHRETGIELGESDQGQHDEQRTVLAVSTAGMLVRRSVWDRLGGLDPRLPLFRDDVDFGWRVARSGGRVVICPDAVMFHAEAATRSARAIACDRSSPHRADRRAAIYTLLANCTTWALPWTGVRLVLGTLLRAVGYLLARLPGAAFDEVAALAAVLGRPGAIHAARSQRKQTSRAPHSAVRPLLPAWWTPYLNGAEAVMSRFGGSAADRSDPAASARRLRAGQALVRGLVALGLLGVAALAAGRGLWFGDGLLRGGALLPAPAGASDWWRLYLETWHPTGVGSDRPTSPYVAVLAAVGAVALGKAWLVVDVVMLLAVPLSAIGAYVLARRLVLSTGARIWMALAYGLLPVLTGAATSGHVGTVVATILLPWLVRAVLSVADGVDRGSGDWQPVFAAGLVLAVMVAFCPLSWPMAAASGVLAVGWLLVRPRGRARRSTASAAAKVVVLVASPLVVLLPWSLDLLSSPGRLLDEAGRVTALSAPDPDSAWQVVFGRLGASGDAPWWISAGVAAAALVALLRADRRPGVAVAWVAIALGAVTAAIVGRQSVTTAAGESAYPWLGFAVVVSQGAAVVAAGLAADGMRTWLQSGSYGWRRPVGMTAAFLAVLTPVAGLAWWVVTAPQGDLDNSVDETLPAYVVDTLSDDRQQRALVVRGGAEQVSYSLWMDDGRTLGDDSVEASTSGTRAVDDLVARTLSDVGTVDASALADEGIGYVALVSPASPVLEARLDSLEGLTRVSSDVSQSLLWQVDGAVGLFRLVPSPPSADGAQALASTSGHVDVALPPGPQDRVVDLAVPPGSDFDGTLDGVELAPTAGSDSEGFTVGSAAGRLEIGPGGHRGRWLFAQLVIVVVALVLAAPPLERPPPMQRERP